MVAFQERPGNPVNENPRMGAIDDSAINDLVVRFGVGFQRDSDCGTTHMAVG